MRPAPEPHSRLLHVANGDSTTHLIAQAGLPGARSIWADVLHEGPVPATASDDELRERRAQYLADRVGGFDEVLAEFMRWEEALETADQCDELVLWFEHDLFDQLNLIQVLDRLDRRRPANTRVSLVSLDRFPGHANFKGIGELTPDEVASLFEVRTLVGDARYVVARHAWTAFRAPVPTAIEAWLESDSSVLPFLAPALKRHLEEFPSVANGLSRTEERMLGLIEAGHTDIRQAFSRMHDGEACFYIADTSFWTTATALAAGAHPLIGIDSTGSAQGGLASGTLRLTPAGRDVLAGATDRVNVCGIDRWLGGVHLEPGNVWRWDSGAHRIIR